MMISTAIQLKSALELFCLYYREVHLHVPLEKDLDDLTKLQSFLLYFYDATLSTESRRATIDRVTADFSRPQRRPNLRDPASSLSPPQRSRLASKSFKTISEASLVG